MKSLVLGGGGFIGQHLVDRLKEIGHHVTVVDLRRNPFAGSKADQFIEADLRDYDTLKSLEGDFDWIFQLAADMGGAGYVFTGEHDADIMHNSAQINLNVLNRFKDSKSVLFYASSACIYPEENQMDPLKPNCAEDSAYPANPDSEYGWEKLFSERLYQSYARNYGTDIRIARFHNVYGSLADYDNGKEKAPAALSRKIAKASNGNAVEIWGDGNQTRSFLYITDCVDGIIALMKSGYKEPINIGSEEMISINELASMLINFSGKNLSIHNIEGPRGVAGRCSENSLCRKHLHWEPQISLKEGMEKLYSWINEQVSSS